MKRFYLIPVALLFLFLLWRVEFDTSFLPARANGQMTQRERSVQPPPPHAVPFGERIAPDDALLYRQNCAACHGMTGQPSAYLLNHPEMPHIAVFSDSVTSPAETRDIISQGRGAMPAFFPALDAAQIHALAETVQLFRTESPPEFPSVPPPSARPEPSHVSPEPAACPSFNFLRAGAVFVLAAVCGFLMWRLLFIPICSAEKRTSPAKVAAVIGIGAAAAITGGFLGTWGGFILPASAFALGGALTILYRLGNNVSPALIALQTAALAVSCYAAAAAYLTAAYCPPYRTSVPQDILHTAAVFSLIVLSILPHAGQRLRRPFALSIQSAAAVIVLYSVCLSFC